MLKVWSRRAQEGGCDPFTCPFFCCRPCVSRLLRTTRLVCISMLTGKTRRQVRLKICLNRQRIKCKPRANLLKKVSKNSKKNHECYSQLTSSIYKISWSNPSYSTLEVTKRQIFWQTVMVQMHLKFVFFVTFRVRWI